MLLLERGNGYLALNLKRESPTRASSAGSTPSTHAILYIGPGPMIHRGLLVDGYSTTEQLDAPYLAPEPASVTVLTR
jgi:hypothetical protein